MRQNHKHVHTHTNTQTQAEEKHIQHINLRENSKLLSVRMGTDL